MQQLPDANGQYPLTYDAIGNLKSYGGWTFEWEAGRQLKRQTQNATVVTYDYDHSGMRVRKTVANTSGYVYTTYNYTWHGDQLAHMTKGTDELHFFYDAQGRPAKVDYNGVIYTYVHNLQGDIVGILDGNGTVVVEYKYNAWGTQLSRAGELANTLGYANPFRYRGYIYDDETWMYWLRSRYYYPELHRFINADNLGGYMAALMSHNVYSYCANVPVMLADTNGHSPSIVTFIKRALANGIKSSFLSMVDWVAQKPYAVRSGKMVSFSVSKKYISRGEEKSHNDSVANFIKWTKRGLMLMAGSGLDYVGGIGKMISVSLPSSVSKVLSRAGTYLAADAEDAITDFFVDSFSVKQGEYTSICATFQRTHNHLIFLHCDNDYTMYEIRSYGGTYFELWIEKIGCYSQSVGPQKVAELDIMD